MESVNDNSGGSPECRVVCTSSPQKGVWLWTRDHVTSMVGSCVLERLRCLGIAVARSRRPLDLGALLGGAQMPQTNSAGQDRGPPFPRRKRRPISQHQPVTTMSDCLADTTNGEIKQPLNLYDLSLRKNGPDYLPAA